MFLNKITISYKSSCFKEEPFCFDPLHCFTLEAIQKVHHSRRGWQKKWCRSLNLPIFSVSKFFLFCISRGSDIITMTRNQNTSKRIATCKASILTDPKNYNSTIFLPCRCVNMSAYKAVKVKAVISEFFYLLWYYVICLSVNIYTKKVFWFIIQYITF